MTAISSYRAITAWFCGLCSSSISEVAMSVIYN